MLAGLWGLYFCFGLGFINIAPLIAPLSASLELSATQAGVVLGAWQFVFLFWAVPATVLALRVGVARALTLAGLSILASLCLRVVAPDFATLMAAVALLGLGGPVVSVGAPTLVQRHFFGRQLGLAMGITVTAPACAVILNFALNASVLLPAVGHWRGVLAVWAATAAPLVAFWYTVAPRDGPVVDGVPGQIRDALPKGPGVLPVCGAAIVIFLIDHGYRSWITEIGRAAGYGLNAGGLLSALSIAAGLVALMSLPALSIAAAGRQRVIVVLCVAVATALAALARAEAGAVFVMAVVAAGFATGPLLTLGLMPIVTDMTLGPERRILTIACYFSTAQVGGTLGPLLVGGLRDATGGFAVGLFGMAALAALIPLLLRAAERPMSPECTKNGGIVPGELKRNKTAQ